MYAAADMPLPFRRHGEHSDLPPVYAEVLAGRNRPNGIDNSNVTDDHWRELLALTFGMITHVDTEIGRVLAALQSAGIADDTIVVFVADHGDMLGDHGLLWKAFYTFRGCIAIPFIVSAPGMPGGRTVDGLVSQIDLMPSLLDLCGLPVPGTDWQHSDTPYDRGSRQPLRPYPGHSWRGLLDGTTDVVRDSVVIENDDPTTGYRVRSLVTPTHRVTVYPGTGQGELFDLVADPWELHNLWSRPDCRSLRDNLVARLLDAYALDTPLFPVPPWNA